MIRLILAIILGKFIYFLTRIFNIGGGSAAPGYYALQIFPDLVSKLSGQITTQIIITGTNGKTTTARLIAHFLKAQGIKVLGNSTGSNLERGIASALIKDYNIFTGKLKTRDLAVWEVDEAAFNKVIFQVKPEVMVFLNAFRDQLDRYGEVDTVVKNWWDNLEKVDWKAALVVNNGDINTSSLKYVTESNSNLEATAFRVKDHVLWRENSVSMKKASDLGEQIYAKVLENNGLKGTKVKVTYPQNSMEVYIPVPGIYHVYDFLAAFSVIRLLNLSTDHLEEDLKSFLPAFGRIEKINLGNHEGFIFLIKNPAGANAVFETINPEIEDNDRILMSLNDNFADGTDVSWIWDASFELILGKMTFGDTVGTHFNYPDLKVRKQSLNRNLVPKRGGSIIVSGTRSYDLVLRLKYAGVDTDKIIVEPDLEKAFRLSRQNLNGRLFIFPTYTSLLELQKILAHTGVKTDYYWKEK